MATPGELLLHICCAPCGGGCVERLLGEGRRVRLYYSNSNIATAEEFERRLASVRILARHFDVPLEVDAYDHPAYLAAVAGLEREPEHGARCAKCFAFNLGRAAERAEQLGVEFSTTLTVSPHKNSRTIFAAGERFSRFAAIDFKKRDGFLRSNRIARELGFYRQDFCGCEFSRERSSLKAGGL
ncbi:MAG: epoxyqueuosine reductase QueH [Lentisphaeria bacterium]|nr:epoxyqueuosine reductase QueH [Lentisphaeria bacterium]